MEKHYTLSEAAEILGVHPHTIRKWEWAGKIKCVRTPGGRRRIPESELKRILGGSGNRCIIYARVSTHKQEKDGNLERQVERLMDYAKSKGYEVVEVFKEVASGVNENRIALNKALSMIREGKADILLVEFKDRLARFGFSYIEKYCEAFDCRIEIAEKDDKSPQQELVEDLIAIVSSFAARIYGSRAKKKAKKLVEVVKSALHSG